MPLHTGTLYRFVPAVQIQGSASEPEWVKQHCIIDSNSNLRFYADKQRTGGSTMKKIDLMRHYADVENEPQFGRDHVFVIRPFAASGATSPSTRGGGASHREDSRSVSQLNPGQSSNLTTSSPPLSPLRPTSPAILPIVAVSLGGEQGGGDADGGESRQYRSRSSAPDGVMLAARNEVDKRAWISVFREIHQDIGRDDGDSDTDSVRSANPTLYALVGDPPTTAKYESIDEVDDEDDDSDVERLVSPPHHRDDDAQRKRRRRPRVVSPSNPTANPDGSPFSSRSVPHRASRSQQSSPRNRTVPSSSKGTKSQANGQANRNNLHANSRAPVTRNNTSSSATSTDTTSLVRPKATSISARLRRGFSRGGDSDNNGIVTPVRAVTDRESSKTVPAAAAADPFTALTATESIAQTIDTSAKQRRSSRSCPATPVSFDENGNAHKSKHAKRSKSSFEFDTGGGGDAIDIDDDDDDVDEDNAGAGGDNRHDARKSRKSSTSIERRRSPSTPASPRSRVTKQRSQFAWNRERSGTSHVSARRSSFRRGPRNQKSKSFATRSTSTSSIGLSSVDTRKRQSSRDHVKHVQRSATTGTADLDRIEDSDEDGGDDDDDGDDAAGNRGSSNLSPERPDLHSLLFGSKNDLFAPEDGVTTALSDVPIMNDVPADLEIPREQIEKFLSWSTERSKGKSSRHVKKAVSKKKRRFVADGFDLDLTYITDRIVAMGFPSENLEAVYRNDMKETQLFFNTRHRDHYMIYNLCSERDYDHAKFDNRVVSFPFDDHNCPPFDDMEPFCDKMDEWLCADEQNVAALHCKAGKGRTGLMICVYLIHTGMWKTAAQSLNFYGVARTYNQKGVTIPSQRRWVWYFEKYCQMRDNGIRRPLSRPLIITKIFVSETAPVFHSFNVKNKVLDKKYSSKRLRHKKSGNEQSCVLNCGSSMVVHKDVRVEFVKFSFGGGVKNRVFSFWFDTDFIENHRLRLEKADIDKVNKDKKIADFWVEVFFEDYQPAEVEELKVGAATTNSNMSPSVRSHTRDDTPISMMERKLSDFSDVSMMTDEELLSLGKQMKRALPVKNRSWKLKVFKTVFCGREAVQWLLEHAVATIDDAVAVGQQMLELGVFHFVRSEKASVDEFQNTSQFYRFGPNKERQRGGDDIPDIPSLERATSSPLSGARSPPSATGKAAPRERRASSIQRSSPLANNHPVLSMNMNATHDVSVITSNHDGGSTTKEHTTTSKRKSFSPRNLGRNRNSGAAAPLLSSPGVTEADFNELGDDEDGIGNGVGNGPAMSLAPATDSEDNRSPSPSYHKHRKQIR